MSTAQHPSPITIDAFWNLVATTPDRRLEYRAGLVIESMAGGTRNHALICANGITVLRTALRGRCRVYTADAYVQVAAMRLYLPDISVSCAEQPVGTNTVVVAPELVVEVLSPSTGAFDRVTKLADYRDCPTISTILLIWQDQRRVEVYEREGENLWSIRTLHGTEQYPLHHLPVTLNLAEWYEDTEEIET